MSHLYASLNNYMIKSSTISYLAALSYCFFAILWGVNFALATTPAAASNDAPHLTISPSPTQSDKPSATEENQPEILTATRVVVDNQRTPQNESAEIVVLTLQANNIQVAADWSVTNAANNFAITNGTLSLVDVNKLGTLRATVYLADKFSDLNTAYTDLVSEIIITVAVGAQNANVYAAFLKAYFDSFMPAYGTYTETATGFDVFRTLFGTSVKRAEVSVSNSGYTIGEYATTYPSEVFAQIDFDINGYADMQEFLEQSIKDHGEEFTIIGPVVSGSYIQFIFNRGSIFVAENLSHLLSDKHGGDQEKFQTFKAALDHLLS